MKDREIINAYERCVYSQGCEDCPYRDCNSCVDRLMKDAFGLLKKLNEPTTDCNYESIAQSHSEEIRKLHDKLADAEITLERTQRELNEAEQELKYLRTIKATTEAFLGVKIDGNF